MARKILPRLRFFLLKSSLLCSTSDWTSFFSLILSSILRESSLIQLFKVKIYWLQCFSSARVSRFSYSWLCSIASLSLILSSFDFFNVLYLYITNQTCLECQTSQGIPHYTWNALFRGNPRICEEMWLESDISFGSSSALQSPSLSLNGSTITANGVLLLSVSFFLLPEPLFGLLAFGLILLEELAKCSEFVLQVLVLVFDLVLAELKLSLLSNWRIEYVLNYYFLDSNCS